MGVKNCFSERLRELREKRIMPSGKPMSQGELGEALGISRGSVSFYENADRTADIETLYSAAKFFNVSVEYLLGISPTEGEFSPVLRDGGVGLGELSAYSKMRMAQIYDALASCADRFENYRVSKSAQGIREPWICETLFASLLNLITAYDAVGDYLEKGKPLSAIIYKYDELVKGSDLSLDMLFTLSRWMEGSVGNGNRTEEG